MNLQLENINVFREKRQILKDISFNIQSGEFVGILGPSGSGKSTLIEILSLTGTPSEGRVLFDDGKNIFENTDAYKKLFRYVPQQDALFPTLTVFENVWYAARILLPKRSVQDISDHVHLAIRRVGLKEHQNKQIAKLSGGQRKRVGIAIALLGNPRLLILDEPTSGLDPAMERKLMLLLKGIAESGTTVICSTHVMENVKLFDKIAVIDKIKIVGQETECGKLLDFLPVEKFPEKVNEKNSEKNNDYGKFFEKLEADPGVYYWNNGNYWDKNSNEIEFDHPLQFIADVFRETLRPVFENLAPVFRFTDNVLGFVPAIRQTFDVFLRSLLIFWKDSFLPVSTLLIPLVLGFLIVLSQQNETNIYPMLFFAIVVSLWFGMNNSVRCIVSERKLFVRDQLSGLTMNRFLCGKTLFYLLIGVIQIGLLWGTLQSGCKLICLESLYEKWTLLGGLTLPGTLLGCYFAGLGLGLLVSCLATSESVAVSIVPLFIMPQILLSTVAAGNSLEDFNSPERILPIAVVQQLNEEEPTSPAPPGWEVKPTVGLFKWVSFFCYSRPALMILELKIRDYPNETVHRGERQHFFGLIAVTWIALWMAFRFNAKRWRTRRD